MEQKPIHYDGSGKVEGVKVSETKSFEITDEMRKNISANPFTMK